MNVYVWSNALKNAFIWYWWAPWSNTIAYYPLTSSTTVNDMSGNNRNLTNNWWITFWTNWWIDCASFSSSNNIWLTLSSTWLTWNPIFTLSAFINRKWYTTQISKSQVFMIWPVNSSAADVWVAINWDNWANNEYQYWSWWVSDVNTWAYNSANEWELVTFTNDWTNKALYINWTKVKEWSLNINITWWNLTIWSFPTAYTNTWQRFYWYMSNVIIENKVWTATEVLNYYNLTKSNYWL